MSLAAKGLWIIERNLRDDLSLDDIADACGVSRFHLAHAFASGIGIPVMQYVRLRRLSRAALALAEQSEDILSVALDAGYGSHEAFTRAFKAQFGVTPETVRKRGSTEMLVITPAATFSSTSDAKLADPRFVDGQPMILAGLSRAQTLSRVENIPALWREFMMNFYGGIHGKTGLPISVTSSMDGEGNFLYLTATEVARAVSLAGELTLMKIPAQRWVVFLHADHVRKIGETYNAIFNRWMPDNNRTMSNGPWLERHMPTFDPRTGEGGVEIWLPLAGDKTT